ncbi:MAG TPA: DUF4235 domain-containing protein [Candidatus Nanopelagicales bacterium]|jgi:hypothetical protein
MTIDTEHELEPAPRVHPLLHLLAPVVAAGAVWVTRQVINQSYQRMSGRTVPAPSDPRTSWKRAFAWAALTATTAAVIEVAVHRVANERFTRRQSAGDIPVQS